MSSEIKNNQEINMIDISDLLIIMNDMKTAGYRLAQSCASKIEDKIEVLYTLVKDSVVKNYKVVLGCEEPELPSITGIYPPSFIYENEMHDLFGVIFDNLDLDYGGKFFVLSEDTPWNPEAKIGGAE